MSERPVALVTAPFRGPGLDRLREVCDVVLDPWIVEGRPLRLWNPAQLGARIDETGARIVICEADMCQGEVLDRPLIAIGSTRGDPTNVDVSAATERRIPVLRAPGRNADGVAEMAVALLFAVTRHVIPADRDIRACDVYGGGFIPYQKYRAWQVAGRTIGIVGLGAVGRAAAWRFEGLGMKVISADPFNPAATHALDDLLAEADVVSMHAAVTPETFAMMNADRFAAMPAGSFYLNTARAGLHDLEALTASLDSGHLGGAALDHFDGEQLPKDHPLIDMSNVVLTPHIGGATYDTEMNHSAMLAADVAAVLDGRRPTHCANPEVLDV